ncbi:hypothetical protein BG015_008447 [Linnemannia schmuckeri]|uniref:DUF8032 domain-containing protein n=1 Tax=Linnemannia schmuckeri TaxID=64567 RepID=A0A9P5VAH9_9FUNG|nr:hypothetical protein BG015_008447 [Linnemannia schmuckeri]
MLGKLFHYAADAILISAVLAGIKRSTGLTVASSKIESKDVRSAVDQYLGIGEWVVDQGIMFMSNSKYFYKKRMDSDDQHSNSNSDMNGLSSNQERRKLLEAYQAERALNKSLLRASVRPGDHSSRPSHPLNHSVVGHRARKSISVKDVLQSKEALQDGGAYQQQQQQRHHQPPSSTKSIIQHYNTLSKTSKPASTLLGVRRHGAVAHRIEKKPIPTRPGTSSVHSSIQRRDNDGTVYIIPTGASTNILDAEQTKGLQSTKENMEGSLWSNRISTPKAADTFGTKSIRQDRASTVSSAKKQEEIYLSQARLMQWYLMNKRAAEHFSAQEKSAEVQFELVGRSLLEKQTKLQNLQKRFEVEQDLVELESTLGCQRDQLLSIIDGLSTFKADYEEFTAALDREARVLNIPGIDDSNLDQWLEQIKACQSVLDLSTRSSSKDYELVGQAAPARLGSTSGIMMPVQQLLSPSEGVMDALSGLSIEQLSSMEETLRRAKMSRQQPSGSTERVPPSAPPRYSTRPPSASVTAACMKQFMSVMNVAPKDFSPPTKPSITIVDGVPWLTFTYTTRSAASTPYTIRADIDQVSVDDIPIEFQTTNCLYPSANGAEEEYKGSRRDYERECNEQGWKLAHLNPTILNDRKGVLQRAVISLRNASSEQKSRRVKRQEKKTQAIAVEKDVRGPVLPIPRLVVSSMSRAPVPLPLTWQPAMMSSLQDDTQQPMPSNLAPVQEPEPQVQAATQPTQRLPSLGSFETSASDLSSLEFNGYIQGQLKRLRLQINISGISLDDLPHDFKKSNCVYPRSFLTHDDQSEHWNTYGIRQAEESFLNEIGWKLCSINSGLLNGKRLLLQQALDAYRRRFLPSTGQPRARIGPSLLTRSNSSFNPVYSLFSGSDPPRTRHRDQQARVRFDTRDFISQKAHVKLTGEPYSEEEEEKDKDSNRYESAEGETGEEDSDEEDEEYGGTREENNDSEGEDFDEDDEDDEEPSEGDYFEDESGDGSSSEEVFHSQMSLLSFTGSIRTYSLGTGSGSARSRPRIHPTIAVTTSSRNASPLSRSETLPTRKRSWTEFTSQTHLSGGSSSNNNRDRFDKRIRHGDTGENRVALGYEQNEHEDGGEPNGEKGAGVAVEDGGGGKDEREHEEYNENEDEDEGEYDNDDEDEVDWWKSRLNNSEYVEDHNLVSMTTEELIGALTSCYNSDIEDYYDDED